MTTFPYRVRRSDRRTYWQFRSFSEATNYMQQSLDVGYVLNDEAYLCEINADGSEGNVLGWFVPKDGGGVVYVEGQRSRETA